MFRTFSVQDTKWGGHYELHDALTMGYLDQPKIRIRGPGGEAQIPPEALEELAVAWLRSHGWVCLRYEDVEGGVVQAIMDAKKEGI